MLNFKKLLCVLLLLLVSQANVAKTVRLITIGPGDAFWSAFGHTAIAIDNDVFAFGYFSFDEDTFSSFLNNRMYYESGLSDLDREAQLARLQNRDFSVVELDLTADEVQQISDYLIWHNQPENQSYQYDYFLNNCSTKIRDILSNTWSPNLKQQSQYINKDSVNSSYFKQTFPAKHQGLMNFGLALGYGWSAYTNKSAWELMALPVYFEQFVGTELGQDVKPRELLFEAKATPLIISFFKSHWFLMSYVLLWSLFLAYKRTQKITSNIWFIWHGLIGLILLFLWFFTPHLAMDWNFNVLLFSPIGLLLPKFKVLNPLVIVGVIIWLVVALYLGAWYLMPLLLPFALAMKINRQKFQL